MLKSNWIRIAVFGLFIPLLALALFLFLAMDAGALQAAEMESAAGLPVDHFADSGRASELPAAAEVITPTTLSVTILSTPRTVLDSNNPGGSPGDPAPNVFMVEAVVTNTGDYDAVDLELVLDYNEDPPNGWELLPGENPLRTPAGNLGPGEAFYGYWFATYPIVVGQSHQYTVTASAEQVDPVSTSTNYFETPAPGATVVTAAYVSAGNSGVTQISADIVVGVVYTITVNYNLGTNPKHLILSPAANPEFDAGSTRLLSSRVRLYNELQTYETFFYDRLYLPSIPKLDNGSPPEFAEVTYSLLPVTPASTELCSMAAIGYNSQQKYDQFYCDPDRGTSIIIDGDLSFSMTKTVDKEFVQQNGILTYTINYTNNGTLPLQHVWIWDEPDPAVASVISHTASPALDVDESTAQRAAWYLGDLPAAGQPGSTGTLTVQTLIDGAGLDLPDGTEALNEAFFGVNPGSLPPLPALTATVSSTVQAPVITFAKSDGMESIGTGQMLTYTLTAMNSGSVAATNLVLTDVLPAEVDRAGTSSPAPDDVLGQTLVWNSLPGLAPGETLTVTIPVTVHLDAPSFSELLNQASLLYGNVEGHTFNLQTADDSTTAIRRAGFVDGYAFVDSLGDGYFDGDEERLSGVQVSLPAALTPTVTTDDDGYYWFRVEVEEPISVTSGLPAGYFHTTLGTVLLDNTFDVTQTLNFGYAPLTADFGVVYGAVFADHNHDGGQDGGENGLPGVTISATAAATSPVLSGDFGLYTLRFNDSGTVAIEEINPPGYVSTTPDLVLTDVLTGSDQGSPLDFGDFLGIKIDGKVFDDLDANGQDDGEPGLAGAMVSAGSDNMTTAGDGLYTLFARVPGGPILISETDPAAYVSTGAIPGGGMSLVDANTLRIDSPAAGTVYSDGLFGDVLAGEVITVTGLVWDDNGAGGGTPANGQRDGLEPGLADVWVSLSSGMAMQTQSDGSFTLYGPPGITITLTEQNPAGYVSTNALPGTNAQKIDDDTLRIEGLLAGQSSSGNEFGDVMSTTVASFSGAVWDDNGVGGGIAGDGLWQVGQEPPLAGALISLSSGMSALTGPDGAYLLYGPPGAAITITEQNPAGYVSTGAIPGGGAIRVDDDTLLVGAPLAGVLYADNYFGDVLPADLLIGKLDEPDPVTAGTLLTYTLNFQNDGPSYAQSVVISDVLPAGVTFDAVLSQPVELSGPSQDGPTLTWSAAALDNGYSGSIVFQVVVDADQSAGAVLTNTASLASNMPDLGPGANEAQAETTVDRQADLAVDKRDDPDPVVAGESLTYTLQVSNLGPSDASGVVVTDSLPADVTFVSYLASQGTFSDTTGLWSVGDLALDASATLTINVHVASNAPVSLTNSVKAAAVESDPNPGNNTFSEETDVIRQIDLALTKSDDPDPVVAGESLTYTLQVSNLGPSDASGVLVTDTLPAEVNFSAYQASQGAFDDTTGLWTVGDLALNASATLTIEVNVDSNAPVSLTNYAIATADQPDIAPDNDEAEEDTDVIRQVDLALTKSDDPDPVVAGEGLTYTLEVSNLGPSDASGVVVTDSLPADVTFVSYLASQGTFSDTTGLWTVGDLALNASAALTIEVTVAANAPVSLTNEAEAAADQPDPVPDNNKASEETAVLYEVDLALTKSDDPDPVVAGESLTYTLEVSNLGPSDASGVLVTDTLPAEVTFVSYLASQGAFSDTTGLWTAGDLAPGASATLTINVDVASNAPVSLTNRAVAAADQLDLIPGNNTAVEETDVIRHIDLALTKSDDPDPVVAGESLTYTLQVVNLGPSDASGVLVTDTLPAEVNFSAYQASQGTFDDTTGLWTAGDLALNASATLTIEVGVDANAPVSLTNSAVASADQLDTNDDNNSALEVTDVVRQSDLAIAKSADPDPVAAGVTLTYTINITNHGPSAATGVTVTDQLPGSLTYLSASASQGSYDAGTGIWTVGDMADAGMATLDIVVTVKPGVTVSVTNAAAVSGEQDDPVGDNNQVEISTAVTTVADLVMSKSDDPDPATAGEQLTYTLLVDNDGPSDASGVSVLDMLPAGLTYASSGASQGSYDPASGVWTVGELAFGQSATLTITADIDPGLTGTITNTATVSGDQFDPAQGNNTAEQATGILAEADMAIKKWAAPDPVTAGTYLTYTLQVENLGPSDATGVSVSDSLAEGLSFQAYASSQGAYNDNTGLWDVGLLTLGQTATLTITVEVDADQLGSIDNTAAVSAEPEDPDPENNSAGVSSEIETLADLAIAKSDQPDPVAAGGVVSYTLNYQNIGPSDALTVTIVDTLPDNVTFLEVVEETPPLDGFEIDGQVLTWSLARLADGQAGSIVFTIRVDPDVIGAVFNDVRIASETADPLAGNNADQSETAIGSPDQATIYGYVYADLNVDGYFDEDVEPGLAGVEIWLDDTYSTTTDAAGLFFFITDQAGVHKVTEVDPEGYFSTTSNRWVVTVSLGASKRVDFGDAPDTLEAAAIYGVVFDDVDSSGTWEDDESGLIGVTITLNDALSVTTDLYGGYTFSVTVSGTQTVVETDLPYYFSTTPNTVEVEAELGSGYEENFGDVLAEIAACDADPFEDDDVYEDAASLPIGAWQRHDFCDDAVDWTVFSALAGSVYTITTSSFDQRVDTHIALYDRDGQTLIAANDDLEGSADFSSQLTWRAVWDADYYLRTSNMGAVTGRHTEYDVQVVEEEIIVVYFPMIATFAQPKPAVQDKPFRGDADIIDVILPDPDDLDGPLGVIDHMCPDAYEVDDTWLTAAPVDHGDVQVHSFDSDPILWAADKDYLGFTLKRGQSITFSVTTVTNTLTTLELFDRHGQSLGLSGTDELVFTSPTLSDYSLSVSPLSSEGFGCSNEVGYEIAVEKSPRWVKYLPVVMDAKD